jgi:putative transposase
MRYPRVFECLASADSNFLPTNLDPLYMDRAPKFFVRKTPADDLPGLVPRYSGVFITVCSKTRRNALANDATHNTLRELWSDRSFWCVGRYVIMPDHIHLFAREQVRDRCSVDRWVSWWKSRSSHMLGCGEGKLWQRALWDTRLYSCESYQQKIDYVQQNPVRAGLVSASHLWRFQGVMHPLGWFGD